MWQPVLTISGYILGILGLVMLVPVGFEVSIGGRLWSPFMTSALLSFFFGFSLFLSNYTKFERINLKQAYLITTVSWILVCAFSAVPFLLYGSAIHVADALFESMAGLTGTSATIMTDVEALPPAILLWRSLLNGIGGLGIVIFAVALLPFLEIGGMQIFQRENSDSSDKFMPKFSYIAKRIVAVYLFLISLCCVVYILCGMSVFDAVNQAMSVIGTGGFSTKNNSIAGFNSVWIELATMVFMICGALPMTFYVLLMRGGDADKNRQVRSFFKIILFVGLCLTFYVYATTDYTLLSSLRYCFFTAISLVTTTGLASCNFLQWGVWTTAMVLFLSLIGGCTGSTGGSIKILRWQVIYAFLRKYLLSAIEPHRVIPIKIGSLNVSEKVTMSVFVYLFSFLICLGFFSFVVSLCGVDFSTAFAAVMACITNVGLGAVDAIGPEGNFAFFSANLKMLFVFIMFLGRLEVITVLVLFSKSFWR